LEAAEEEEQAHGQNSVEDKKELTPTLQLEVVAWEVEEDLLDIDNLALWELNGYLGSRILAAVEELAVAVAVAVAVVADLVGMLEEEVSDSHYGCWKVVEAVEAVAKTWYCIYWSMQNSKLMNDDSHHHHGRRPPSLCVLCF
jgi:hypothetical protein